MAVRRWWFFTARFSQCSVFVAGYHLGLLKNLHALPVWKIRVLAGFLSPSYMFLAYADVRGLFNRDGRWSLS